MARQKLTMSKNVKTFFKTSYKKSSGFVRLTCAGNKRGMDVEPKMLVRNDSQYQTLNNELLLNDNRKVSLNSFNERRELTERNLRDITAIAIKADIVKDPSLSDAEFLKIHWMELEEKLKEAAELTPTYIIVSDAIYYVYVLENNVFVGNCKGAKKAKTLRFITYIQQSLCDKINKYAYEVFQPVALTDCINIPGTTYAVFQRTRDPETKRFYAKVVRRGTVEMLVPEKGHTWESLDALADAAHMVRYESYRKGSKNAVKHHIKNREFYGIDEMQKRRMQLAKAVLHNTYYSKDRIGCGFDEKLICNAIFIYFNAAFHLTKDFCEARKMTISDLAFYFRAPWLTEKERKDLVYKHLTMKKSVVISKQGYKYSDEKIFEVLKITKEEAAEKYGYITENKKEYNKAYSKARYAAKREEQEANGETCWQKMATLNKRIASLRMKNFSIRKIAEKLSISASTVNYHLKKYAFIMEHLFENGIPTECPI